MPDEEMDYTPLPHKRKGEEKKSAPLRPPRRPGIHEEAEEDHTPRTARKQEAVPPAPRREREPRTEEEREDYTPRPARQERTARARPEKGRSEYTPRPARRAAASAGRATPRSGKRGRFWGSKTFWRLAAVSGLVVLVLGGVLAELFPPPEKASSSQLAATGNQYYDQGIQYWNQLDYAQALASFQQAAEYFRQALSQNPSSPDPNVETDLGTMYFYQGQLSTGGTTLVEKAVQTWLHVLSYAQDKPETLLNLGRGYVALGQVDQGLAAWRRVIEVAPGTAAAQSAQQLIDENSGP